jgi:hypothetical protein
MQSLGIHQDPAFRRVFFWTEKNSRGELWEAGEAWEVRRCLLPFRFVAGSGDRDTRERVAMVNQRGL